MTTTIPALEASMTNPSMTDSFEASPSAVVYWSKVYNDVMGIPKTPSFIAPPLGSGDPLRHGDR